jgi:hypothetical protein
MQRPIAHQGPLGHTVMPNCVRNLSTYSFCCHSFARSATSFTCCSNSIINPPARINGVLIECFWWQRQDRSELPVPVTNAEGWPQAA